MKTVDARQLAKDLIAAADAAEAAGKSEIDLIAQLQATDDAARAGLLAALNEAKGE